MRLSFAFAEGAIMEALRPRNSGWALDAHVSPGLREPKPDYERMRRAVTGEDLNAKLVEDNARLEE